MCESRNRREMLGLDERDLSPGAGTAFGVMIAFQSMIDQQRCLDDSRQFAERSGAQTDPFEKADLWESIQTIRQSFHDRVHNSFVAGWHASARNTLFTAWYDSTSTFGCQAG